MGAAVPDRHLIRVVPPLGFSFSRQTTRSRSRRNARSQRTKPSFFSASPFLIEQLLGPKASELENVLDARRRWAQEHIPIEDSLPPDVVGLLRSSFSFEESGVTTLVAEVTALSGGIKRTLTVTRDARSAGAFAERSRQALALWERTVQ